MARHKMHFPELPYYLTVWKIIDSDSDTVSIEVESKVHVDKITKLPASYSTGFVATYPNRFSAEVLAAVIKRFGLTKNPTTYS